MKNILLVLSLTLYCANSTAQSLTTTESSSTSTLNESNTNYRDLALDYAKTISLDDLKGLVMAPVAVDESHSSDPNIENDSGSWIELVRPELCGGLSVMGRYLRGPTRQREIQLKGLNPDSPNVVCMQVQFGNR